MARCKVFLEAEVGLQDSWRPWRTVSLGGRYGKKQNWGVARFYFDHKGGTSTLEVQVMVDGNGIAHIGIRLPNDKKLSFEWPDVPGLVLSKLRGEEHVVYAIETDVEREGR